MKRIRKHAALIAAGWILTAATGASAAPPERPTLNHHTADPRPNILPNSLFNFWVPYRQRYNRPSFVSGATSYHISATSLEAMSWAENHAAGRYHPHHQPPMYKGYFYPKPWEGLNVEPRPGLVSHGRHMAPVDPTVDVNLGEHVPAESIPAPSGQGQTVPHGQLPVVPPLLP
jgi:hypothetical protein